MLFGGNAGGLTGNWDNKNIVNMTKELELYDPTINTIMRINFGNIVFGGTAKGFYINDGNEKKHFNIRIRWVMVLFSKCICWR